MLAIQTSYSLYFSILTYVYLPKKHWKVREDAGLKRLTLSRWGQGRLNLSQICLFANTQIFNTDLGKLEAY